MSVGKYLEKSNVDILEILFKKGGKIMLYEEENKEMEDLEGMELAENEQYYSVQQYYEDLRDDYYEESIKRHTNPRTGYVDLEKVDEEMDIYDQRMEAEIYESSYMRDDY